MAPVMWSWGPLVPSPPHLSRLTLYRCSISPLLSYSLLSLLLSYFLGRSELWNVPVLSSPLYFLPSKGFCRHPVVPVQFLSLLNSASPLPGALQAAAPGSGRGGPAWAVPAVCPGWGWPQPGSLGWATVWAWALGPAAACPPHSSAFSLLCFPIMEAERQLSI